MEEKIISELSELLQKESKVDSLLTKKIIKEINSKINNLQPNLQNYPVNVDEVKNIDDLIYAIEYPEYESDFRYNFFNLDQEIYSIVYEYFKFSLIKKYTEEELEEFDDEICIKENEYISWLSKINLKNFKFNNSFWKSIDSIEYYLDLLEQNLDKIMITIPHDYGSYSFAEDNKEYFKQAMYGLLFYNFKNNSKIKLVLSIRYFTDLFVDNERICKVSNFLFKDDIIDITKEQIKYSWTYDNKTGKNIHLENTQYLSSQEMVNLLTSRNKE